MFELMVDGILVAAPDAAAIYALHKQGKINDETPLRKKGSQKWSRVKNLKANPKPQIAPAPTKRETSGHVTQASNDEFIQARCSQCGKVSKVRRVLEGKAFRCKACGELVSIQSPTESAKLATKQERRLPVASEVTFDDELDSWDDADSDGNAPFESMPKLPPRAAQNVENRKPASKTIADGTSAVVKNISQQGISRYSIAQTRLWIFACGIVLVVAAIGGTAAILLRKSGGNEHVSTGVAPPPADAPPSADTAGAQAAIDSFPTFAETAIVALRTQLEKKYPEVKEVSTASFQDPNGRTYKVRLSIELLDKFTYDIRKADSLITPVVADLHITGIMSSEVIGYGPPKLTKKTVTAECGFRDGKWSLSTDVVAGLTR
ncbi:MAG: hypothetical protein NTX48_04940 [Planctomycetales bacterium]|nr:hypothetical protein [Planctomycetales bacterium]